MIIKIIKTIEVYNAYQFMKYFQLPHEAILGMTLLKKNIYRKGL